MGRDREDPTQSRMLLVVKEGRPFCLAIASAPESQHTLRQGASIIDKTVYRSMRASFSMPGARRESPLGRADSRMKGRRNNNFRRLATFALLARAATCYASECAMLDARIVQYATASCEGASASSCWTVRVAAVVATTSFTTYDLLLYTHTTFALHCLNFVPLDTC